MYRLLIYFYIMYYSCNSMPSGGGHHGGGHHGGGHHGGGHHGGGHHGGGHHGGGHHHGIGHHHHHHHYGGGGYYGYNHCHRRRFGVFYYSPFRWFYRGFLLLVIAIIIGIVFMSIGLSNVFSGPTLREVTASPEDDRVLSYSQSSCGDIEISTFQYSYPVMLYLMYTKPGIVTGSSFTVSNTWSLSYKDYNYYYYYLLTQSTIEINVYSTSSSGVDVYILSRSQFVNFDDDDYFNSKFHAVCSSTTSSSPCVYSYTVTNDDEYYIVFDEKSYSNSVSNSVHTSLSIQKTKFVIQEDEIYGSCNASCSLPVPVTPTLFLIVITGDVTTGSWTDSVLYTWYCSSVISLPTWVYVLLVVGVVTAAASIVGLIAVAVLLCYRKKNTQTSEPLITTAPQVPPPANPTAPPTSYQLHPPVAPSYPSYPTEQPPPSYGWVSKN